MSKFKYDGRSRPADDKYRKEFNRIFNKDKDPFKTEVKEEKEINEKELKEIADRNGF
tara:strand:- start:238 stop:408 length:171 start_codon:yes stop_codon:yes gene_type:complete